MWRLRSLILKKADVKVLMSGNPRIYQSEYRPIESTEADRATALNMSHHLPDTNVNAFGKTRPDSAAEPEDTDSESESSAPLKKKGRESGNTANKNNKKNKDSNGKQVLKDVGTVLLATAAMSGAVIGGIALALPAIGFGSLGVTAGSLAALYQSSVLGGTIASGSVFATLQSIGAVGLSSAATSGIVAGSAVASTAATTAYRKSKDKIQKK